MQRILLLSLALTAAAFAGCMDASNSTLYVKDALTDDVAEVHVTFTKAQVKPLDGTWTTVFDGKTTIELLSLSAADAKSALAGFDLAPGEYEGLRIAVSEVTIVDHDGNEQLLNVFGNIVSVSEGFTVGADGIDILVDFDLEAGVDLAAGTYTPVVKDVQTSDDDSDGDGQNDVDDTDDDNDGRDDAEDDDDDGDGEDDRPRQHYADNIADLCAAERDEELAEAEEELNESLAEAIEERDEDYAEAESLNGTERDEAIAEADAEYEEETAEAYAEFDEELADIADEHADCLEDIDDEEDDDEDSDDDESDEDSDDESDDEESDDEREED